MASSSWVEGVGRCVKLPLSWGEDIEENMRAAIKEFLRNRGKVEIEMASEENIKRPFIDAEENDNS